MRFAPTVAVVIWASSSAFLALTGAEEILAALDQLGYPDYVATIIGLAKIIAVAGLVLPVGRRIQEWAYAGLFLELTLATVSYVAVGATLDAIAPLSIGPIVALAGFLRSAR